VANYWYVDGILCRDNDLPASEFANGDRIWYVNGKIDRNNDLHTIEFVNGKKLWRKNKINYTYNKIYKYYQIFTRFGRYCLKKIRMRKLRRLR
jgi:uncharacterized protein YlzI (FlbEa/FlbD family)